MAQAVSRRPMTVEARVSPCGICVDEVALGQVFLRVLCGFSVNIIPPLLSILIYLGDEQ
jgi:hypothetical protein